MAQLLYDRHSVKVHLNIVNRHIHLSHQIKGAEPLASNIEPLFSDLKLKATAADNAKNECEFKRDNFTLADTLLDDKVRDVLDDCKKYDRDNPGLPIKDVLFPSGISKIIYAPKLNEPVLVENLILSIESLGEEHTMAIHIPILQAAIAACKTAIETLNNAISNEKNANAQEAIAKNNLTRQYEQNYYDAGKKFGKKFINRLFPPITKPKKSKPDVIIE